jgi:hypothetical protein
VGLGGASEFGFDNYCVVARPFSGQQIIDRITIFAKDDAREDVGEIRQRIDLEKFAGLCRTTNYAERTHFCQRLS